MSEKSGLYYPNLMARIYLQALEEVMGKSGVNALLNLAGLPELIGNYPSANLDREFDFSDFSSIGGALEEMYGPRGGRGLGVRAGRAAFAEGLSKFGATAGVADLAFKVLPTGTKLKVGLKAMAETFNKFSDQQSDISEEEDYFIYSIRQCPVCWSRKSDRPICFAAIGILQEGLHWVSGGKNFRVEEVECVAQGYNSCVIHIYKEPLNW